jgi:hypothetical protein
MYTKIKEHFSKGINVFIGENGTGKTKLLEGIWGNSMSNIDHINFIPSNELLTYRSAKTDFLPNPWEMDIVQTARLYDEQLLFEWEIPLVEKLKNIVSGDVTFEVDTFYIQTPTGEKIPFWKIPEGYKRLALLCKLITIGEFHGKSILRFGIVPKIAYTQALCQTLLTFYLNFQEMVFRFLSQLTMKFLLNILI